MMCFRHMKEAFNCPNENGQPSQGGREIVAIKGLYIQEKICLFDL